MAALGLWPRDKRNDMRFLGGIRRCWLACATFCLSAAASCGSESPTGQPSIEDADAAMPSGDAAAIEAGDSDTEEACLGPLSLDPAFAIGGIYEDDGSVHGNYSALRLTIADGDRAVLREPFRRLRIDGSRDSSFHFDEADADLEMVADIANAPGAKLVVALGGLRVGFDLVRLDESGARDFAFAEGGKATIDVSGDENLHAVATEVVVQPDGKPLVVGYVGPGFPSAVPAATVVARFMANGSVDTSFGGGLGFVKIDSDYFDEPCGILVQRDGSILVCTRESDALAGPPSIARLSLIKLRGDGQRDSSFGADGIVLDSKAADVEKPRRLFEQPDGKIIAAGRIDLRRYHPTGMPDDSFGTHGMLSTGLGLSPTGYSSSYSGVAIDKEGRIAMIGDIEVAPSVSEIVLELFTRDGAPCGGRAQLGRAGERLDGIDVAFDTAGRLLATVASRPSGAAVAENRIVSRWLIP